MITTQRVRVRWSAAARGAPHANVRRGLGRPVVLPAALPACEVVVHDVLADEVAGYVRRHEVHSGVIERAREIGLWLSVEDTAVAVERLPGWAVYPRQRGPARLFRLLPEEVGRYRANFRFTGCACNPSWFYEDWVVHVSNGPLEPDRFIQGRFDHDIDDRVHLYGGASRSAGQPQWRTAR